MWKNIYQKLRHLYNPLTSSETLSNLNLNFPTLRRVNVLPEQTKEKFNNKLLGARQWYEEFTGIDEVRAAQSRVLEAEARFITAQDLRRSASSKLNIMHNRLRDIYAELDNTKRGEDRYVVLITEELKLLKEERMLAAEFQTYEREERENFSVLSSALKDSHEKERLQAERTKYWSIIGSVLGTVLGIVGSSINNQFRMKELRRLLHEAVTNRRDTIIEERLGEILAKLNHAEDSNQSSLQNSYMQEVKLEEKVYQQKVTSEYKFIISLVLVGGGLVLLNRLS